MYGTCNESVSTSSSHFLRGANLYIDTPHPTAYILVDMQIFLSGGFNFLFALDHKCRDLHCFTLLYFVLPAAILCGIFAIVT